MDAKAEKIALFRYGLIAPLVLELLPRGELTRHAQEIAARYYDMPASTRTSVSVDTLLDWALRYRQGGFEALAPQPRHDRGQPRAITPQLADLIERLKRENPSLRHYSAARVSCRPVKVSRPSRPPLCIVSSHSAASRSANCSLLRRTRSSKPNTPTRSGRRTCSVPYGQRPAGGKIQVFLHAILDDASRLIPHAEFYLSQGLDACLDCLRQAIAARGVPVRLYIDNTQVYRSPQVARIAASLGALIIHSRPYQPEGRGKIERYFRSLREQFLANLDRKQALTLEELNERLWAWIDNAYHRSEHSSLGTTPLLRWQRDIEHIPPATSGHRSAPSLLRSSGSRGATRLHLPAAEPALRGAAPSGRQTIEARFDPLDTAIVEIYFQGQPQGEARLVDRVVNGLSPSAKPSQAVEPEPTGINFVELLKKKKDEKE